MGGPGPSLYVHVPFCRSRCGYCHFVSYVGEDADLEMAVVRHIAEEAARWAGRLGGLCPPTVFVGGGTPSVLRPTALECLLRGVGKALSTPPAEYTVEANPESLTPRFLETCAEAGVNRLSLGIQTFSEEARRSAGRFCPQPDITHALAVVRDTWRGRLNLDLIAGFPAQRQGDVRRDVEVAAEIRPDHVSLYALTHEGETLTADREDRVDELWIEGVQRLEDLGYANYEICNFARPGQECLHNLVYWRLDPYLGIGPSAVSTLPDGQGGARRLQNPASLDEYLAMEPDASGGQGQALPPEDLLFEILIMGLRLRVGIEIDTFERRLGRRPPDLLPRTLAGWSARSLLAPLPGRLALRPEGRIVLDALLVEARQEIDTVPRGAIRLSWP